MGTAEGIETGAQSSALRGVGIDHGQGYLFGKPTAAERIRTLPGEVNVISP